MTPDPNAALLLAIASAAAWLMMQAGLAKNMLELRRKRHTCASCGRHDRCTCSAQADERRR